MRTAKVLSKLRRNLDRGAAEGLTTGLLRQHFLMQDERPAGIGDVEIAALDPFLRGLLFTDGTVTRALTLQMLAPVAVERLGQDEVKIAAAAAACLEAEAGGNAIRRRVRIGTGMAPLLWAESHILPERLPPGFMGLLDGAPDGIGQSLQRVALESSRELLWLGRDQPPAWTGAAPGTEIVSRQYRIVSERRPAILIRESFAVATRAGTVCLAGLEAESGTGGDR